MLIKKILILLSCMTILVGCECNRTEKGKSDSTSGTEQNTSSTASSTAFEFKIDMPEATVVGPNVRAGWTNAGHPANATYSYMVGKANDCKDGLYRGNDLPVNKIALNLTKGVYFLCVSANINGTSINAANSPYQFKVVFED